MAEKKFYICRHCGNLVGMVFDSGVNPVCCGEKMEELKANVTDASGEKHVPVVTVDGDIVTVRVGSVDHPMEEKHYIQWIYLDTEKGGQRKVLKPGDEPVAKFALTDGDEPIGAYEYCNLHGLWYGA
jgi:superoxide reductase